jgi:hypothetical protein
MRERNRGGKEKTEMCVERVKKGRERKRSVTVPQRLGKELCNCSGGERRS